MTKMITLKTVHTADEPDRTKKYKTATGQGNFHYDESRSGWTWGAERAAFPWDKVVDSYSHLFPLEEFEKPVTVGHGVFKATDIDGDRVSISLRGDHSRAYAIVSHDGDSFTAYLEKADLVKLRDLLVEKVKDEEDTTLQPW